MSSSSVPLSSGPVTAVAKPGKALHIVLWVVQALLGFAFIFAGLAKSTQPFAELAKTMLWTTVVPQALVRFIGVSELLGGIGLLLPSITRIKPRLTPLAGLALATVMLFAAVFHIARGEFGLVVPNAILGGLALVVAWGRGRKAPIAPRG